MIIRFDIEKENGVPIDKPIISNGHPIGVIKKAIEKNKNNIVIEAQVWDRFINVINEYRKDSYYSMSLDIK
jgi:hypothetical protein